MRLSERCALWRLLPVWVVSLHATKEDTHITHSTHVLSLSLPLSLSLWHTHTHTHTSVSGPGLRRWRGKQDECSLLLLVVYVLSSEGRPAVGDFSHRTGAEPSARLYGWESHGVNSGVLWPANSWADGRGDLSSPHDFMTYFFLLKQLALAFSDYITFFQRWMWSWRVFWEPTLFFRWMCQERLALIFKRLTDKRLKRSVALGICAMKYASEFAKRVWPCDLLKYCLLQNIWFFLNRHLDDSCFLICKTKKEKKHKRDCVMI